MAVQAGSWAAAGRTCFGCAGPRPARILAGSPQHLCTSGTGTLLFEVASLPLIAPNWSVSEVRVGFGALLMAGADVLEMVGRPLPRRRRNGGAQVPRGQAHHQRWRRLGPGCCPGRALWKGRGATPAPPCGWCWCDSWVRQGGVRADLALRSRRRRGHSNNLRRASHRLGSCSRSFGWCLLPCPSALRCRMRLDDDAAFADPGGADALSRRSTGSMGCMAWAARDGHADKTLPGLLHSLGIILEWLAGPCVERPADRAEPRHR